MFRKLFGEKRNRARVDSTAIGNIDAVCASCDAELPKKPSRKAKCPKCGEYNYVRKRPLDGEPVLLREDQLPALEREKAYTAGEDVGSAYDARQAVIQAEREKLRERFGAEPSQNDVMWGVLNQDLLKLIRDQNYSEVRNTYAEMATILKSDKKHRQAAIWWMIIFTYDIDPGLSRNSPFVAPGVISRIAQHLEKAKMTLSDATELYMLEVPRFIHSPSAISFEAIAQQLENELAKL